MALTSLTSGVGPQKLVGILSDELDGHVVPELLPDLGHLDLGLQQDRGLVILTIREEGHDQNFVCDRRGDLALGSGMKQGRYRFFALLGSGEK